jgi:hypothetical protein
VFDGTADPRRHRPAVVILEDVGREAHRHHLANAVQSPVQTRSERVQTCTSHEGCCTRMTCTPRSAAPASLRSAATSLAPRCRVSAT